MSQDAPYWDVSTPRRPFRGSKKSGSSQRLRHHFPVLGALLAPGLWLLLVLSNGSPTSLGLPILLRAVRPRSPAESADLFAGVAARMGVGSAMAGAGTAGAADAAGGGVASTADVAEDEGRATSRTTGRHKTQAAASASNATTAAAKTTTRLRGMIERVSAVANAASGTKPEACLV